MPAKPHDTVGAQLLHVVQKEPWLGFRFYSVLGSAGASGFMQAVTADDPGEMHARISTADYQ